MRRNGLQNLTGWTFQGYRQDRSVNHWIDTVKAESTKINCVERRPFQSYKSEIRETMETIEKRILAIIVIN